jgi:hypothetical protein
LKAIAAGLFLALLGQLVYGLRTDGLTDDESVYIGAGYRHLHGDFSINPEQPPMAKLLGALPLLTMDLRRPDVRAGEDQCGWSYRFIHELNRSAPILARARMVPIAVTLALAALLWWWACGVGGPAAGVLALALAAFQPAFLAHGHLVATDLPSAAAMLAASYAFWRYLAAPSPAGAVGVAAATTIAILARLTAGVLVPAFAILGVFELWRSTDRARTTRALMWLAGTALVVAPILVWATYGFRYAPGPGETLAHGVWPPGVSGAVLRSAADHQLLPHSFLEAVRFQIEHASRGHAGYLLGDRGRTGWPYYYLVTVVAKNTPGLLALLFVALWRWRTSAGAPRAHWLVPAALLFTMASLGRIQIGERYIVAVYAYLILWIATTCAPLLLSRRGRLAIGALLLAHALPVLWVASRGYLTYFNALAGGPSGGHRWLADSNLDWGQDLPRLAAWMRAKGIPRVQLAYFGSDDPDRYGIAHDDLPAWHSHHPVHAPAVPFTGTVVVSPNLLLGFLVPPGRNPYDFLYDRPPDDRAGIFFVYHLDRPPPQR